MSTLTSISSPVQRRAATLALAFLASVPATSAWAVTLGDQPVFASSDVPGNLALALSVEYPTAISVANLNNYADATEYMGYFDPKKCYTYQANTAVPAQSYFQPAGMATGTNSHTCSGKWSGNFMNWATMQTIDPFRWALTGGYRSVDDAGNTILEKGWGASQGGESNFPLRGTSAGSGHNLSSSLIGAVTPFTWTSFNSSVWSRGNRMVFTGTNSGYSNTGNAGTDWVSTDTTGQNDASKIYQVYIRIKVCDPTNGTGGVESNCVKYGANYKPEGLMQQYANKIRYATFSYLNAGGNTQQGGVMRASMGYIGPTYPQPLSSTTTTNGKAEWRSDDGRMIDNPDIAAADDSGVANSGAMNYLNKFGQYSKSYMTYDAVSELYYAVIRYFRNQGNVPEWTSSLTAAKLDGFPAPTSWANKDPISYSCQKNFILGIGDNNTHYDRNVGGGTLTNSRPKPASVASDTLNQAATWTDSIEALEGLTSRGGSWDDAGSEYIAGLAYGANTQDMRSDYTGKQTVATYWMDVMEYQTARDRNPYWLAAKYGGFSVPSDYIIGTPLTDSWWTTGETINMGGTSRKRPDNYFLAGNAAQMVSGLKSAFTSIANAIKAFTTSFSFAASAVESGTAAYASQYDSKGWTGVVTARQIAYATDGSPTTTDVWSTSTTLESQLTGSGWNTGRRVATINGGVGVPFRAANLSTTQNAALNTSYRAGDDSADYLDYLRGDRSQQTTSTTAGSSKAYRTRDLLLADIVNAKVTPVAAPNSSYGDTMNPGYGAFKTTYASRPTIVYVGANDGMLHAFNGALTGTTAGQELFAYVPSALFEKAVSTDADSILGQLGKPTYAHHFSVDATPLVYDVDLNRSGGAFVTNTSGSNANWRSLLIGGLGKGGKSYYALDVTDPNSMTTEADVASKVRWEFTDPTMGYSYGAPVVVKTKKYGWVVVLTSGYNNSDGYGYLYFVDPKNGALLEKVSTGVAAAGLTHAAAYVQEYADFTADAIYAGDLDGNLWRFDLTGAVGSGYYPAPTKIAAFASTSAAQPITTTPLIEIHPVSRKRFIMVGTGKLLDSTDVVSAEPQSFYAVIDGGASTFAAVTTAATRSDLTAVTDPTVGVTLTSESKGWYIDLGTTSGVAWRINSTAVAYNGVVAFSTLLTAGDACSPSGQSRVYVLNYATGKTVLTSRDGYVSFANSVTDLKFVTRNGVPQLIVGDSVGGITRIGADLTSSTTLRLLNWREVPTVD